MAYKTRSSLVYPKGFTIIEILVAMTVLGLLFSVILVLINPVQMRQRARDSRRTSDLYTLERIITEYKLDTGSYPDFADTVRHSNILPSATSVSFENISHGWINADFEGYAAMLPSDPLNDATYNYSYQHTLQGFELNARLEYDTSTMTTDGGDNANRFEVGNILTIISL